MNPLLVASGTAAVFSGRVRGVLRKGAVYGLAGVLSAGDAVVSGVRGVVHEAEHAASATTGAVGGVVRDAQGVSHKPSAKPTAPRTRAKA
jgi:hypothetical protein